MLEEVLIAVFFPGDADSSCFTIEGRRGGIRLLLPRSGGCCVGRVKSFAFAAWGRGSWPPPPPRMCPRQPQQRWPGTK